jgi:hypothetical protein
MKPLLTLANISINAQALPTGRAHRVVGLWLPRFGLPARMVVGDAMERHLVVGGQDRLATDGARWVGHDEIMGVCLPEGP